MVVVWLMRILLYLSIKDNNIDITYTCYGVPKPEKIKGRNPKLL